MRFELLNFYWAHEKSISVGRLTYGNFMSALCTIGYCEGLLYIDLCYYRGFKELLRLKAFQQA